MSLKLMYITNIPSVALIAEKNGVDRIMIDLETQGKEERQKNMNTVKSTHTVEDIRVISEVLEDSELLVRVNPWNDSSLDEIEAVIDAGAERIMLPMWKTDEEVTAFLQAINNRVHTILLLETKEAVENIDKVLENPLIDEIYIGLNDLHLSYGLTFMFEPLANGIVDFLCEKFKKKGIPYGFGGIAKIGEGMLPAEYIILEHYRLGSSRVILSRSFCNTEDITDVSEIEKVFSENMKLLKQYEESLIGISDFEFGENVARIKDSINSIVGNLRRNK